MHDGSHSLKHGRYAKRYCWCCFKKCIDRNERRKYCNWCRILKHKDACWAGLSRKGRAEIEAQISQLA